jgi:selenoprotein W-related protein
VRLNGEPLWNKKQAGRYPEPKEIKQLIRDRIAPEKHLGHSDRKD